MVFLDFEGTQFSSEMIAIGAVCTTLDKKGQIKRRKNPFKIYVRSKNRIGHYVEKLTGISEDLLKKEGVSFSKAMEALKKYVGIGWSKSLFMTFGNNDLRILNQSIRYTMNYPKEICSQVQKNYADFTDFLNEFVRDEKGNPLSLVHCCEAFEVEKEGPDHDPAVDAVNLANLYDAVCHNKERLLEYYKKAIVKVNHFPSPVQAIVHKLSSGETVTPEDYEEELRKYLD